MDNVCFVRESFYVQPPSKDASLDDWKAWDKEETQAAITAKRNFSRQANKLAKPIDIEPPQIVSRGKGGIYRSTSLVGLTGDFEAGTGSIEAVDCDNAEEIVVRKQATKTPRNRPHRSKEELRARKKALKEKRRQERSNR